MLSEKDSSIEKRLITTKLSKLREYLKFLRELQAASRALLVLAVPGTKMALAPIK